MYTVAPILFPQLVTLFQAEQFGPSTRARVLSIFGTFVTLISHMDSVDGNANQNLLFPILPGLVETTVTLIAKPVTMKEGALLALFLVLLLECVSYRITISCSGNRCVLRGTGVCCEYNIS